SGRVRTAEGIAAAVRQKQPDGTIGVPEEYDALPLNGSRMYYITFFQNTNPLFGQIKTCKTIGL
ncbi:MAG: hypothetical protein IJT94_14535, partial [Oscillibacter sp.]|nr:hypothetical protein [Oscillibacter sp.]